MNTFIVQDFLGDPIFVAGADSYTPLMCGYELGRHRGEETEGKARGRKLHGTGEPFGPFKDLKGALDAIADGRLYEGSPAAVDLVARIRALPSYIGGETEHHIRLTSEEVHRLTGRVDSEKNRSDGEDRSTSAE